MVDKLSSKEKKSQILQLAASGSPKPNKRKHPLGSALANYTTENYASYDAEFKNKLQELRPDWYKTVRDSKGKKAALLELAASGGKKPLRSERPLGNALQSYITSSQPTYDPEFKNKIQELRPDWFPKNELEDKKAALLELAISGAKKPMRKRHRLGFALHDYVNPSKRTYDPELKNKLQEVRPDWFLQSRDPETKKELLLKLAASGAKKSCIKEHRLLHTFTSYISQSSRCYDPEFKDKLQEIRPDWFQRNHDPESKKAALLELAASGEKKPVRLKHPLGSALEKYIMPSSQTWDPEFRNKLQEMRPDWFSGQMSNLDVVHTLNTQPKSKNTEFDYD